MKGQQDTALHPDTPRWNGNHTPMGDRALLECVIQQRGFSFLLSAEQLEKRDRQSTPAYRAAEALSKSYGYGQGRYQGD